jgi:hypothetical protein
MTEDAMSEPTSESSPSQEPESGSPGRRGRKRKGTAAGPLLLFVHIPKTAGTSLTPVLEAQHPEGGVVKITNVFKGSGGFDPAAIARLRQPNTVPEEARVLRGHLPYGIRDLLPAPIQVITLLREPVDRLLSHYYALVADGVLDPAIPVEVSLNDRGVFLDNLQTRMLSGTLEPFGEVTGEMLTQAKANLASSILFGLSERFDESLVLFKQRLGWGSITYRRRRVNDTRPRAAQLPAEASRAATLANVYDLELYRFARELFERTIESQDLDFAVELAALRVATGAAIQDQPAPAELAGHPLAWSMLVRSRAALLDRERELAAQRTRATIAQAQSAWQQKLLDSAQAVFEQFEQKTVAMKVKLATQRDKPMPHPGVRLRPRRAPTAARKQRPDRQPAAAGQRSQRRARSGDHEERGDRRPAKKGAQQAHDWLDRELPVGASQPAAAITAAAAATGIEEKPLKRGGLLLGISLVPEPDGSWTWMRAPASEESPERADAQPPSP